MSFVRANYPLLKILWNFKLKQCKRCKKHENKLSANKLCDMCQDNLKKTFKITYNNGTNVTSNGPNMMSNGINVTSNGTIVSPDNEKARAEEEARLAAVLHENKRLNLMVKELLMRQIKYLREEIDRKDDIITDLLKKNIPDNKKQEDGVEVTSNVRNTDFRSTDVRNAANSDVSEFSYGSYDVISLNDDVIVKTAGDVLEDVITTIESSTSFDDIDGDVDYQQVDENQNFVDDTFCNGHDNNNKNENDDEDDKIDSQSADQKTSIGNIDVVDDIDEINQGRQCSDEIDDQSINDDDDAEDSSSYDELSDTALHVGDENTDNNNKKILILSDSITRRMEMDDLNADLKNGFSATRKHYPGLTPDQLERTCLDTLAQEKPRAVVIHCGTNSIKKESPEEIGERIVSIAVLCRTQGARDVFVSGLTYRRGYCDEIRKVNQYLNSRQVSHGFHFICNSNISPRDLWRRNLHLNDEGVEKMTINFAKAINRKVT